MKSMSQNDKGKPRKIESIQENEESKQEIAPKRRRRDIKLDSKLPELGKAIRQSIKEASERMAENWKK